MFKKIMPKLLLVSVLCLCGLHIFTLVQTATPQFKSITGENICVGLNYHRVRQPTLWNKTLERVTQSDELTTYSVYADDFAMQMDTLIANDAYFATAAEVESFQSSGQFPDKCVTISFDDVDKTVYTNAFLILQARGIPFTVFLIADHVGDQNFNNLAMASWDDLRAMQTSGLVTFGSHTANMHYLEDESAVFLHPEKYTEFAQDIAQSRQKIEAELKTSVHTIAYPFGESNDAISLISQQAGFSSAYILAPNPITPASDAYYLDRYVVSKLSFEKVIQPWIEQS